MSKRFRFLLVLALLAVAAVFLLPSFRWYALIDDSEKELSLSSREQIKDYTLSKADEKLKELQKLLVNDRKTPLPEEYLFLTDAIKAVFKVKKEKIPSQWTVGDVADNLQTGEVLETLQAHYRNEIVSVKEVRNGIVTLGLDLEGGMKVTIRADFATLERDRGAALSDADRETAMKGALEILNNRIDQFGVTEPQIRRQGKDRIIVEMPGAADPERIRRVIMGKGRLNFHLANNDSLTKFIEYRTTHPEPYLKSDGVTPLDPELKNVLDEGTVLRGVYEKDAFGMDLRKGYAVIDGKPGLSGERIQNAYVQMDPLTNRPLVLFTLDSQGGEIFYKLTSENKGKVLAVVLDEKVKAQATIQDAIRDRVQVTGFGSSEATDLALVLKTGALPVPLEIISQEAVGASLGEDTIRQALNAIVMGLLLVILFMLVYYKGAGLIADFALVLNFYLMAAILSVFNFTLTLPGIAGFILTVGMAVDANVIIYERIKEEYQLGKSRDASIKAGFSKAFWTIMDANITTGIAALTLAQFGKGPIQGFAVMLAVGIVCSMISALFVSRLIFDFNTDVLRSSRISISWRTAR
ncbi:MAG TPA: protein translocase subunit SecD [Spirochaetia bacterium]|nr:protein translocase subunit SecD [Spirochaetia bacterium]